MHFQRINLCHTAAGLDKNSAVFRVHIEGHRHIAEAITCENFDARTVAKDGEALIAVAQRGGGAVPRYG